MTELQLQGMSKRLLMITELDNFVGKSSYSLYNHAHKSLIINGGKSNRTVQEKTKRGTKPEVFDEMNVIFVLP